MCQGAGCFMAVTAGDSHRRPLPGPGGWIQPPGIPEGRGALPRGGSHPWGPGRALGPPGEHSQGSRSPSPPWPGTGVSPAPGDAPWPGCPQQPRPGTKVSLWHPRGQQGQGKGRKAAARAVPAETVNPIKARGREARSLRGLCGCGGCAGSLRREGTEGGIYRR